MTGRILLGSIWLAAAPAHGARVIVQDPCADSHWLDTDVPGATGRSAGDVTISALDDYGIPYAGSAEGLASIKGTVTGDAALEVLGEREMRAYGWCFKINGVEPTVYPHEVRIQSETDVVHWVFGFAHYLDGAWVSYCTPTHVERPPYICGR